MFRVKTALFNFPLIHLGSIGAVLFYVYYDEQKEKSNNFNIVLKLIKPIPQQVSDWHLS